MPAPNFPLGLCQELERLDALVNEELRSRDASNSVQSPLYHYTSNAGLRGITTSGTIWMGNAWRMNDPDELVYGIGQVRALLEGMLSGETDLNRKAIIRSLLSMFDEGNFKDAFDCYLACFSRKGDDLNQWRLYGDDGHGYAIGFDPSYFEIRERPDLPRHHQVIVTPVHYGERALEALIRRSLEQAVRLYGSVCIRQRQTLDRYGARIQQSFGHEFSVRIISGLLITSILATKAPSWKDEEEVRLVLIGERHQFDDQLGFHGANIAHIALPASIVPTGAANVMCGPCTTPEERSDVTAFLISSGTDPCPPITASSQRYRSRRMIESGL